MILNKKKYKYKRYKIPSLKTLGNYIDKIHQDWNINKLNIVTRNKSFISWVVNWPSLCHCWVKCSELFFKRGLSNLPGQGFQCYFWVLQLADIWLKFDLFARDNIQCMLVALVDLYETMLKFIRVRDDEVLVEDFVHLRLSLFGDRFRGLFSPDFLDN